MTLRRLSLLALGTMTLSALAFTTPAFAQDDEDPEPDVSTPAPPNAWDRLLAVSATLGIDTPIGVAGAALEFTPFRYLAIYAGGGVGREGGRMAAGLRPQFPMGDAALGMLLGLGGGPFDWDSAGENDTRIRRHWDFALFFHSGVTVEYRWTCGLFGRLALGVEAALTDADVCTYADGDACAPGSAVGKPVRGWAGLTIGYALDL